MYDSNTETFALSPIIGLSEEVLVLLWRKFYILIIWTETSNCHKVTRVYFLSCLVLKGLFTSKVSVHRKNGWKHHILAAAFIADAIPAIQIIHCVSSVYYLCSLCSFHMSVSWSATVFSGQVFWSILILNEALTP